MKINNNNNFLNNKNKELDNQRIKSLTQFNNFHRNANTLLENRYVVLYHKILLQKKFVNYINYTKENRINFITKFPLTKKVFNFPIITNILICQVNNIIGYCFSENNKLKMFLVHANLKTSSIKLFDGFILVSERILLNKLGNVNNYLSQQYRPLNIDEIDNIKYIY